MDQWLILHASSAGDAGSIPGQGTKIPHAQPKVFFKKMQYLHPSPQSTLFCFDIK